MKDIHLAVESTEHAMERKVKNYNSQNVIETLLNFQ